MRQLLPLLALLTACNATPATRVPAREAGVPFQYAAHFLTVPVRAGGIPARFVLDTGIGVSLITPALCARLGCRVTGAHTGKRMSGQAIRVPLATIPSLTFGPRTVQNAVVGVFDLGSDLPGVEGFLSIGFFEGAAVTVDYAARRVVIEDARSLARRAAQGKAVAVVVKRDGPEVSITLPLVVAGHDAQVVVDTGSNALILHDRYLAPLGVQPEGPEVRRVEGKDETGNPFVRHFATLPGPFAPRGAPELRVGPLRVMFQAIIHDGLVGDAFLRQFTVTYDLPGARMIFARATRSRPPPRAP